MPYQRDGKYIDHTCYKDDGGTPNRSCAACLIESSAKEVRVKDPATGAEKGSKPERYDLIPSWAMDEVARVYGKGAEKYAERNWEKGYKYGLSIAAIERHISQYKQGHNLDDGEGGDMLHHMAHVVFHALALITYDHYTLGTDDRSELCQK